MKHDVIIIYVLDPFQRQNPGWRAACEPCHWRGQPHGLDRQAAKEEGWAHQRNAYVEDGPFAG